MTLSELPNRPRPRAYYLGTDAELESEVGRVVSQAGVLLSRFEQTDALRAALAGAPPEVLILDISLLPADQPMGKLINDLVPEYGHPPSIICISHEHGIEWRLQALRGGAQALFSVPAPPGELSRKVIQLANAGMDEERRVLIVEDDPIQSRLLSLILRSAGIASKVLANPLKILDAMESVQPDLVLMELQMPGVTGAELTAIIRQRTDFGGTPIVLLALENDVDQQLDALRAGADSVITKPVNHRAVISSVENQIRIRRWLRDHSGTRSCQEADTGLLDRKPLLRRVDRLMRDPNVVNQGWALMVIEVDGPQRMLENLGISATERLLVRIGVAIASRLSAEEYVGRIADTRYCVVARRPEQSDLDALANRLRTCVDGLRPSDDGPAFHFTVSVGIGSFVPAASDSPTLISRAIKAAATAHRGGGNQITRWTASDATASGRNAEEALRPLLTSALEGEGFRLNFQPILPMGSGRSRFYEVLLRLRTRDGELIPPMQFLPVADRLGMTQDIDRWVLSHVLDVLHENRRHMPRLMVHQRASSVAAVRWMTWFREQIIERDLIKLLPELVFQVDDLRPRRGLIQPLMPQLDKLGVEVWASNVTGATDELDLLSSLGIKRVKLPFNRLTRLGKRPLADLVGRLKDQGFQVVASALEEPEAVALAWSIRPDYVQGHYLQMPSPSLTLDFDRAD